MLVATKTREFKVHTQGVARGHGHAAFTGGDLLRLASYVRLMKAPPSVDLPRNVLSKLQLWRDEGGDSSFSVISLGFLAKTTLAVNCIYVHDLQCSQICAS